MKIGVFADVHNNAVALDAVLRTLEDEGCEVLACAGDIIGIGPWPEETVQRLMRIPNLIAVRGNHERYLLEGMPAKCPNDEGMDEAEMACHRWEHSRLSAASIAFLRALPDRADVEAHGRRIAVMHYGMDSDRRFGPFTPHIPTRMTCVACFRTRRTPSCTGTTMRARSAGPGRRGSSTAARWAAPARSGISPARPCWTSRRMGAWTCEASTSPMTSRACWTRLRGSTIRPHPTSGASSSASADGARHP